MRISGWTLLTVAALAAGLTGCSNTDTPGNIQAGNVAPPPADAANGNLAPVDQSAPPPQSQTTSVSSQYSSGQYSSGNYNGSGNSAPAAPNYQAQNGYDSSAYNDQSYQGDGQVLQATEAPPPLPEYSQPPCPGDNYLWTPGYWSYASEGYYWVPGVWVVAPYVGALWTPPYWGYANDRYLWHSGFWGSYIGFYGGIDYGFGYTGRGYYGGRWQGNQFDYNSSVNNVNVGVVHNVYNYRVANVTNSRVSYNGGNGGIGLQPTAPENAALRERRMAPVAAQVEHARQAAGNRAQFASVNHGRPAQAALPQPLHTEYRTPAARPEAVPGNTRMLAPAGGASHPAPQAQQARQVEAPRPAQQAQQARQMEAPRPAPQARQVEAPRPAQQARQVEAPRPAQQARQVEAPRPAQQARQVEAPRPAPQARQAEAPRPAQQARQVEAPRPAQQQQARPAPQARQAEPPHPAPRPAEHAAPHPEEKKP